MCAPFELNRDSLDSRTTKGRPRRSLSGGAGHPRRITSGMPDGMNDNFGVRGLVENQIGVRRRHHSADGRIVSAAADVGILYQQFSDGLNAGLDPVRALWRLGG